MVIWSAPAVVAMAPFFLAVHLLDGWGAAFPSPDRKPVIAAVRCVVVDSKMALASRRRHDRDQARRFRELGDKADGMAQTEFQKLGLSSDDADKAELRAMDEVESFLDWPGMMSASLGECRAKGLA